ncbi:hypothetical protein NCC78_03205 [Micromonospora phytophila]|uniref:hypothetical protein n=1 Tax=Micromonospora phytophila TaxID=709888 RepID=UPI002030CCF6|nr:hypothetical protein [Micromonospora phytophila]MCM0673720.1 hypothetical protein [Micromonospora phytophila]
MRGSAALLGVAAPGRADKRALDHDPHVYQLRSDFPGRTPSAVTAIERSTRPLAAALIGTEELVRPEAIVIGGFAASVPGHIDEVIRQLSLLAWPGRVSPPARVLPARLGDRSSPHRAMLAARGALAR